MRLWTITHQAHAFKQALLWRPIDYDFRLFPTPWNSVFVPGSIKMRKKKLLLLNDTQSCRVTSKMCSWPELRKIKCTSYFLTKIWYYLLLYWIKIDLPSLSSTDLYTSTFNSNLTATRMYVKCHSLLMSVNPHYAI